MKYWKKLTFVSKIVFLFWTFGSLFTVLSGESDINFLEWIGVWLFGCLFYVGIVQILSTRKKKQKGAFNQNISQTQDVGHSLTQENKSLSNYDTMNGHQFEYFCADVIRRNGFINVEVTQGSGDHGIDILAEKDDIEYAIQCKCYSSNIGNAAIQQAHTGKSLYHKDVAVVLTNRYFTAQAKEEAQALGVKLWDRDKLNDMINRI